MNLDYRGAVIRSHRFGPRRELTLNLDVRPMTNTAMDGSGIVQAAVRFGGISNYKELVEEFGSLNWHETIDSLQITRRKGVHLIEVRFDRTEALLRLTCSHVHEQLGWVKDESS